MIEIYYIEDDENIAMAVKEYLSQKGYAVSIFGTQERYWLCTFPALRSSAWMRECRTSNSKGFVT